MTKVLQKILVLEGFSAEGLILFKPNGLSRFQGLFLWNAQAPFCPVVVMGTGPASFAVSKVTRKGEAA